MKLISESLNEFKKGLDPIDSLGLGRRTLIEEWLKKMGVENYIINDDYTIDVNGNVDLSSRNLIEFPEYIQFGKVNGIFNCSKNNLTSLKGSPKYVVSDFKCYSNQLISLKYSPEYVGGHFYCYYNQLTTLQYISKHIGSGLSCSDNKLISLKGCPKILNGGFWCQNNKLITLEYAPKKVKKAFWCGGNPGNFTKKDILAVCDVNRKIEINVK